MAGMNLCEAISITVNDSVHNFMNLSQLCLAERGLKILVCGKSGTGKSLLINTMLEQEVVKTSGPGEGLNKTKTSGLTSIGVHMQDIAIEILDTPSLQDISAEDDGGTSIDDIYKKCEQPDLVIYCVDSKETRWFPQDRKETELLTNKFGVNFWKKTLLVLTKANMLVQMKPETEDEMIYCKRAHDNFVRKFQQQLIEQSVPPSVASNIQAVSAGSERDRYLPFVSKTISDGCDQGYHNFLPELWLTCFELISGKSRDSFLKQTDCSKRVEINKDRLSHAERQLTEDMEEQFKIKEQKFKEKQEQLKAQIVQLQK